MKRRRKVWQHDTENLSEDQMCECFHRFGWEVDRFGKDYGEDLFVRIFEDGIFPGAAFYLQLKGTSDTSQYALKSGDLSYSVEMYIQHYVEEKLTRDPRWLDKEERTIHLSHDQQLSGKDVQSLLQLIKEEYATISLHRQSLKQHQNRELNTYTLRQKDIVPSKTHEFSWIKDEGFQNVASAIREATGRDQYHRAGHTNQRYSIRYGLGRDLMRHTHYRDTFVQALCAFLYDYNAETAREEEKVAMELKRQLQARDRKEYQLRQMVSMRDIQAVLALIDHYGAELIGSTLIAYGYALESEQVATAPGSA